MLRINQSNLTEDEDETLDLFEDAINAFKKAAKLSPGREYYFIHFAYIN
jgi:hypothetical protein